MSFKSDEYDILMNHFRDAVCELKNAGFSPYDVILDGVSKDHEGWLATFTFKNKMDDILISMLRDIEN